MLVNYGPLCILQLNMIGSTHIRDRIRPCFNGCPPTKQSYVVRDFSRRHAVVWLSSRWVRVRSWILVRGRKVSP